MVLDEAFVHMDTTHYNLSKIGSKIMCYAFANMKLHIESMYRIETGRRWKMKTPKCSWIFISFTWGQLDNFEKSSIYGFYDFLLHKNINSTKIPSKF